MCVCECVFTIPAEWPGSQGWHATKTWLSGHFLNGKVGGTGVEEEYETSCGNELLLQESIYLQDTSD